MILFQPAAYRKIGNDPALNGPALLLALISLGANLLLWHLAPTFDSSELFLGLIAWFVNWGLLTGAACSTTLILRDKGSEVRFVRGLMFCSIFDLVSFGVLIPGLSLSWLVLILLIRLAAVSTAISGISEIEGRKKLLIVPCILCVIGIILLAVLAVTDSLAYLLDIEALKGLTDTLHMNLFP